jgi:hypothetical protein
VNSGYVSKLKAAQLADSVSDKSLGAKHGRHPAPQGQKTEQLTHGPQTKPATEYQIGYCNNLLSIMFKMFVSLALAIWDILYAENAKLFQLDCSACLAMYVMERCTGYVRMTPSTKAANDGRRRYILLSGHQFSSKSWKEPEGTSFFNLFFPCFSAVHPA